MINLLRFSLFKAAFSSTNLKKEEDLNTFYVPPYAHLLYERGSHFKGEGKFEDSNRLLKWITSLLPFS